MSQIDPKDAAQKRASNANQENPQQQNHRNNKQADSSTELSLQERLGAGFNNLFGIFNPSSTSSFEPDTLPSSMQSSNIEMKPFKKV